MDPVSEIKARLPIEELVGQYCQLQKKGRDFVALCPFHNDTHPSFTVSPDKGIAYCFACNTGGDIFSFYQKIEGVDFRQALKDLAGKVGIDLPDMPQESTVKKDEKERLRECLESAKRFFSDELKNNKNGMKYLVDRTISSEQIKEFGIGYAPDSFSKTYEYLLKKGFSKTEILNSSLAIQKELSEGKMYDRFRNRIMFPIHDHQGKIVGFGGRTLGDDDAKYINSSEGPLYRKSAVLYGYHYAKDAMRESKKVIMVEGYFDVLACHKVGINNVVAVSGTALTQEHVRLLKRTVETVVLCLDQDRAGKDAAERAFMLCSPENLHIHSVSLPYKDPDETVSKDSELLKRILNDGGLPYLDSVCLELQSGDPRSVEGKRDALRRVVPLLNAIDSSVERDHFMQKIAAILGTTDISLKEDVEKFKKKDVKILSKNESSEEEGEKAKSIFTKTDITLGLFCLYPKVLHLLDKLIEPEDSRQAALYEVLKAVNNFNIVVTPDSISLPKEYSEWLSILILFCENSGFSDWSESLATQEIKRNCQAANREFIQRKQKEIVKEMLKAREDGDESEEAKLSAKYVQVLKLSKMAR
ncbi:MAG: DNA primase [Candidatus Peribacteraceae bacterium]|nr:DNA primase [Candidatus Peribacteraceae bacterium]